MNISIEQLIEWHRYFSTHPSPTEKIKEITIKLEDELHRILTTLNPAPATTKES